VSCSSCEAPDRVIWSYGRPPKLSCRDVGNWNSLEQCESCSALWVSVPHEPYASFTFWTLWPSDAVVWRRLNDRENGRIIHEWHDALLREAWEKLPEEERAHVEAWRVRTYRHYNPIDRGPDVPLPHYVKNSADLQAYL